MLFFYYGSNSYFLAQKRLEIREAARGSGGDLVVFNEDNPLRKDVIGSMLCSDSLFGKKKTVLVSDVLASKQKNASSAKKTVLKTIIDQAASSATDVFFVEENPSKGDPLFKKLVRKAKKVQEFKNLVGKDFEAALMKEAVRRGIEVSQGGITILASLSGYDLWIAVNELEKAHCLAQGGKITDSDLDGLAEAKTANDIFKTIDALARRDKRKALALLRGHIESGESPFYILSMITYQFRNVLKVKSAMNSGIAPREIPKILKIHPYVARKCEDFGRSLSQERLVALYRKIAEIDYSTKTGAMSIDTALDLFVAFS